MSGLIIVPIFIFYVVVSFFVLKFILKIVLPNSSNKKIIITALLIVLILPFLDLFLQKGVKSYFEAFPSKPIVYSLPKFDENGKLDSLKENINLLPSKLQLEKLNYYEIYDYYIENFVEIYGTSLKEEKEKILRIDLLNRTYSYNQKSEAKYSIEELNVDNSFYSIFKRKRIQFIDSQTGEVLAESYDILFESSYSYFREKVLLMLTGPGQRPLFKVSGINNGKIELKKVLGLKGFINE